MNKENRTCKRCVLDESVPDIEFNANGECNYCELHDTLCEAFPNDERGQAVLEEMFKKIKNEGNGKEYDCVIGISGGVDSTYLIHLAKSYGLRPLAVHVDNGWDSEISVNNIKNSIEKLSVDLYTYVIDWNEMKDMLKSFIKASYIWADAPTDIALVSALYKVAAENKIKHILVGNNFRTEGRQPTEWTHVDFKVINYIHKKFGDIKKLKSYPNLSNIDLFKYEFLFGIKMVKPLYFINYDKESAKKLVTEKYGWKDYGGHHHESIFTRFIIGYWLPVKFNVDKRKITFAAQIRSGLRIREQALKELQELPYNQKQMDLDKEYVIKKLGLTEEEFDEIMRSPNKTFRDFPSSFELYERIGKYLRFIFNIFGTRPMMAFNLPSYRKGKDNLKKKKNKSREQIIEHLRLHKIASLVKDSQKVLDVGCAECQNVYLRNKSVMGLDLNFIKPIANYEKIIVGDVLNLPKPFEAESFDAITAGEIIEHLYNPMKFLNSCYKTLKKGGSLVISTPNPNSIWERALTLNLSRKHFYVKEHVCLYPQRWLIRMLELNGFKNVKVYSGGLTVPVISKNIPFPRPWAEYTIVYCEK